MKNITYITPVIALIFILTPFYAASAAVADAGGLVWAVEPKLEYDEVGYTQIYHNSRPFDLNVNCYLYKNIVAVIDGREYIIDKNTGGIIQSTGPTGGFVTPYEYQYDVNTGEFFYSAEYTYWPIGTGEIIKESQNNVLSIDEADLYKTGFYYDDQGQKKYQETYDGTEISKYSIYYNGKFVSDFIYDYVVGGSGTAFVSQNGKYAFAYGKGKLLTGFIFDRVISGNSIVFVGQNGKFAFADYKGKLITDFIFDDVSIKSKSFAAVKRNGNWGFADLSGNEVIPFMFDDAVNTDNNTAFVKYNGKYGVLDLKRTAASYGYKAPDTGDRKNIYICGIILAFIVIAININIPKIKTYRNNR